MYENFEKALKNKGYRVADLCRITGIGASTFTDWKKGRSVPKSEKMKKIADCLEVSVDYLSGTENNDSNINNYEMPKYDLRVHELIDRFCNFNEEQKETMIKMCRFIQPTQIINTMIKNENNDILYGAKYFYDIFSSGIDEKNEEHFCINDDQGNISYEIEKCVIANLLGYLENVIDYCDFLEKNNGK